MEKINYYYYDEPGENSENVNYIANNDGIYNICNNYILLTLNRHTYKLWDREKNYIFGYPNIHTRDLHDYEKKITIKSFFEKYWCMWYKCENCPINTQLNDCFLPNIRIMRSEIKLQEICEIMEVCDESRN